MSGFVGVYDRSVDGAGRVALPSTFRDDFGDRCYATRDPQGCITLRTPDAYSSESLRLEQHERAGEAAPGIVRALSARTVNLAIDKQGRVTLDEATRTHAALGAGATVMVVGNGRTVEIWRPSRWSIVTAEDNLGMPDRAWPEEVDLR